MILNMPQKKALDWVARGCPSVPFPNSGTLAALHRRRLIKPKPYNEPWMLTKAGERAYAEIREAKWPHVR